MDWVAAVAWAILGITFALLWWQRKFARVTRALLEQHQRLLAEATTMHAALAQIAANTCCEGCQEAALVARRALRVVDEAVSVWPPTTRPS